MSVVRQRDIAARLGITQQAVAYALSDRPDYHRKLNDQTRQRVVETARQLGYVPHQAARNLSLGRTQTIVVATRESLHHPYMHEAIEEIQAELSPRGYHVNLELLHRVQDEESVYRTFAPGRCDGVLVFGPTPERQDRLEQIRLAGMPVVVIGMVTAATGLDVVDYDRAEAVRLGTAYLVAQGHTRVALVYDSVDNDVRRARLRGYRQALASAGLPLDRGLLFPAHTEDDLAALWERVAAQQPQPTAIYCYNDELAVGLSRVIRATGRRVPAEIAIIAQGNTRLTRNADVALTVVDCDVRGIAVTAVERLMEQIGNPAVAPRQILRKPFLVARASTSTGKSDS